MKTTIEPKSGSALLVTLLVVSLLLVVVTTFSAYVRMEMRAVNARMDLVQARQNAKLGMHLALARLQETAGADQRATATAEILGNTTHSSNLHIAGVWDTLNPNTPPEWMISTPPGISYDVTAAYSKAETSPLLGPGSLGPNPAATDVIRAPSVSIANPGNNGTYAYWIADEGVKASLGLHNPYPTTSAIGNLHTTEIDRLRYTVPVRNASEFAFIDPLDFEDPQVNSFVGYTHTLNEFSFLTAGSNPQVNGGFHAYTHNARGLLTHPINGGIKKDLSLAPELFPSPGNGFAQFMNFQNYLQEPSPANFAVKNQDDLRRLHRITPPGNLTPVNGEVVHSVAPVITDFGLQFSPRSASNGQATLMMAIVLELWNPYTTALANEDLILEIGGFQPFDMHLRNAEDEVVWSSTFDPNQILSEHMVDGVYQMRLSRTQVVEGVRLASGGFTSLSDDSYDVHVHGPGRLLYWTGPVDTQPDSATFANRTSHRINARLQATIDPAIIFPAETDDGDLSVGYTMDETNLTVRLRRTPENGGEILVTHTDFLYWDVDSLDVGDLSNWHRRWLTYRFRIFERGSTINDDPSAWLKFTDKRNTNPTFGDAVEQHTHTMHEEADTYAPDHSELRNNLSMGQVGETFYFDRVLSTSVWSTDYRRDIPLFELPRQPLISIGQLQHLYIHGMPAYSIGNPWGGTDWNRLFDDYFLSGIQLNISEPDFNGGGQPTLPHPRLSLTNPVNLNLDFFDNSTLPDLGENSALAFHVDGQFNINSISTEAWKAILASTRFANLRHLERDTHMHDANNPSVIVTDNIDYPAGFTRFPQSIQELFEVDVSAFDTNFDRHILNLKPGVTFLHPRTAFTGTGTDSDYDQGDTSLLDDFATALATGIQQRIESTGRPYFSLTEFITEEFQDGEPILEHLIEESSLRRIYTPDGERTPEERTPAWLSQADVLSALAPFLSTRSDTFAIRTYGDVLNTNNDVVSRAWCEAVVQRVITPVDPVSTLADMADAPDEHFGRRFKILSFKWLSESEI
ncbi:MAG: hypothetical protein WD708_05355 [Kiritimatiellia bacterium]